MNGKHQVEAFIKSYLRVIKPYSTERDEFSGRAEVFLDANESPYDSGVNRYPDPRQLDLKVAIAALKGIDEANIFVGNGSDEAIDLLTRIIATEQGVTITPPTYGMYRVAASVQGLPVLDAPLTADFRLDFDAVGRAGEAGSRLLFLCSPNNPVGNQLPLADIEQALEMFNGIVVVDEAYIDFASGPSATALLERNDRLVVLQTFSKAWGMAGIRLGVAFATESIVEVLNKVKLPYNVNSLTHRYALERLRDPAVVFRQVEEIKCERVRVSQALAELPRVNAVIPSEANFILFRVDEPCGLFECLRGQGIIIRDRSRELYCEGCLRMTIGTREENDRTLQVIAQWARGD